MCIIIVKQNNNTLAPSTIKKSSQINPHGLGIVWLDTFEVTYHKSKDYKVLLTDRPFIAHFRYATIGKIGKANTHPFVCGKNKDEMLMMNGTIQHLGNVLECDTKVLAKALGEMGRQTWKDELSQYDCRFVTTNKRTRTFQIYNKHLWTKKDGTWYSKDNVLQDNLVAVYGTLKKGFGNNYLLRNSTFIGKGVTKKKFPMVASGIPYVLKEEGKGHFIDIELYAVSDTTLKDLDSLEGHPTWYKREVTDVLVKGKTYSAWLYFNPKEKINGRPLLKSFERPKPTYYEPKQIFTFADHEPWTPPHRQHHDVEVCPDCEESLEPNYTMANYYCHQCCRSVDLDEIIDFEI